MSMANGRDNAVADGAFAPLEGWSAVVARAPTR